MNIRAQATENSIGLSEISWLLGRCSPRSGFRRPVERKKLPTGRDMPSVIREYSRSMIPFKSVPAARHRPAHTNEAEIVWVLFFFWSAEHWETRKQTGMHFNHVRRR